MLPQKTLKCLNTDKLLSIIGLCLLATGCASTPKSVLDSAQKAIGNPNSIQYSATGMNAFRVGGDARWKARPFRHQG